MLAANVLRTSLTKEVNFDELSSFGIRANYYLTRGLSFLRTPHSLEKKKKKQFLAVNDFRIEVRYCDYTYALRFSCPSSETVVVFNPRYSPTGAEQLRS